MGMFLPYFLPTTGKPGNHHWFGAQGNLSLLHLAGPQHTLGSAAMRFKQMVALVN